MHTLKVVGGIVMLLLLKKLFHKRSDHDVPAKGKGKRVDASSSSSSATEDCDPSFSSSFPSSGNNNDAAIQDCDSSSSLTQECHPSSGKKDPTYDSSSSSSSGKGKGKMVDAASSSSSSATQHCDSSFSSGNNNDAAIQDSDSSSSLTQECHPSSGKNDATSSSSATPHCDSSSSPSSGWWDYEVFLSFRGEDTRTNFTDHLYNALLDKGIHTFRDNEELRIGEEIRPALLSAIHQSKIAIVIFSKGYASSKWCLLELAEIEKCRKLEGQKQMRVMPVFYDVDPRDVRNHDFGEQQQQENVDLWKNALKEIGGLKGWDLKNTADG